MSELSTLLKGTPFLSYTYSYPHKTVYRPFDPPIPLSKVWEKEDKQSLFLYVHIPFCEMRCGFCNLFTLANPKESMVTQYMHALHRQMKQVKKAIGKTAFTRLAIGGGTPTQLTNAELTSLFDGLEREMGVKALQIPVSFESSPATLTPEKLQLLKERGVDRLSIGIQSFLEEETNALGRPQKRMVAERALQWIKDTQFSAMNIDLIYGGNGQTKETWKTSLDATLAYEPEEIYLYPLYVRPLTGLGNKTYDWDDHRLMLYRQGRDTLLEHGYTQVSMRMFRRKDATNVEAPTYRCQEDGMIGLGAGARSYTKDLHYCTEYAVGRNGVKGIIADFIERSDDSFAHIDYGFMLDKDDQQRRFIILSLLSNEGLVERDYKSLFGHLPSDFLPQLGELCEHGLAERQNGNLTLTSHGFEHSDVLGAWLYSPKVRQLTHAYELR